MSGKASSLYWPIHVSCMTYRYPHSGGKDILGTVQAQHSSLGNYTESLYSIFHTEILQHVKNKPCDSLRKQRWDGKYDQCTTAGQKLPSKALFSPSWILTPRQIFTGSNKDLTYISLLFIIFFWNNLHPHPWSKVCESGFILCSHRACRTLLRSPHPSPFLPHLCKWACTPLPSSAPTSSIHSSGIEEESNPGSPA